MYFRNQVSLVFLLFAMGCGSVLSGSGKTATELIKDRGFDVEEFDVISQRTYVLKVYRIINPLANPNTLHRIPVVCAHGVTFDMANMMAASKYARPRAPKIDERVTLYAMENGTDDKGLYFYLSNNNYDVWLLEARATNDMVMRRLNEKEGYMKKSFWDFSIDEQALIDLPTQIDFVLLKTGAPKVAYIAYSQSTGFMFGLLAIEPEYSNKLAAFIAIAPVFYLTHYKGMVWPATKFRQFTTLSSANPWAPRWLIKLWDFYSTYLCSIDFFRESVCRLVWRGVSGPDAKAKLEGGLIENMSKSTSFKNYEQVAHNSRINDVRFYDYKDENRNMEEYGQPIPPKYNASKITARNMVFFRGIKDYLGDAQDQMLLISKLTVPLYEDHVLEDYSHIEFISSPTLTKDVNEPILRVLDKLTNRTVNRVSHTLGNPNPRVIGTPLTVDLKNPLNNNPLDNVNKIEDEKGNSGFLTAPKVERPHEGIENRYGLTVREELFGKN